MRWLNLALLGSAVLMMGSCGYPDGGAQAEPSAAQDPHPPAATTSAVATNPEYWAGPGATPTIDTQIAACGSSPCVIYISPLYSGPESTHLVTTSHGYKVYAAPTNITIHDLRQTQGSLDTPLYSLIEHGRDGGQLTGLGENYWASSPTDSVAANTAWTFFTGAMPSNGGTINGAVSVVTMVGPVTIGGHQNVVLAQDAEAYDSATSADTYLHDLWAYSGQVGIRRPIGAQSIDTAIAYRAQPAVNESTQGATITNAYGFDAALQTVGTSRNYGFHNAGNWLTENGTSFDAVDAYGAARPVLYFEYPWLGIETAQPAASVDLFNGIGFNTDQGGSIELGSSATSANQRSGGRPYVDFHYGNGRAEDYNTRIINDADRRLSVIASTFSVSGGVTASTLSVSGGVAAQGDVSAGGYIKLQTTTSVGQPPPSGDCINSSHYGRMRIDAITGQLWVCVSTGWIYK